MVDEDVNNNIFSSDDANNTNSINTTNNNSLDNIIEISPDQKKEQKRREDYLKNSVTDMNTLYESLGKSGRGMRIRPEQEYWIFEAKPEKQDENT
ncbi:MAG: hypothetical protein ACRD8Z_26695 [Nitrososphaeraceae archaeon]